MINIYICMYTVNIAMVYLLMYICTIYLSSINYSMVFYNDNHCLKWSNCRNTYLKDVKFKENTSYISYLLMELV